MQRRERMLTSSAGSRPNLNTLNQVRERVIADTPAPEGPVTVSVQFDPSDCRSVAQSYPAAASGLQGRPESFMFHFCS